MTLEKKAVIVDSFAKFRVSNVQTYYTATSGDQSRAEQLLKQAYQHRFKERNIQANPARSRLR